MSPEFDMKELCENPL